MDVTLFLAQMWGPVILATSAGVFVSREYYIKIYRDLENNAFAILIFGMSAMGAGIAQILFHNTWSTLPEALVSFLGWGLFLKGLLFVVLPQFVDQSGDWWLKNNLIWLAGIIMLVIGAYLSWFAYLA